MKNELDMIKLSHMYADSAILGLEVGRDVLGAPIEVRGGSGGPALPDNFELLGSVGERAAGIEPA